MDYTLEGIDGSLAPIHGRSSFSSLFGESTELGRGLHDDSRLSLIAAIYGLGFTGCDSDHPDLITTLNDLEFEVPGGEEARPYWLEGAKAARATLLQLDRCDLRARLCRCWFGSNRDGSVSLDVTVHLPGVHAHVCEGDEVNQGALAVMKLEHGTFQTSVSPRIYRIVCANGLGRFDHLGHSSWSETPDIKSVRDVLETRLRSCLLDSESFDREVEQLRQADGELVIDPEELLRWAEQKAVVVLERSDRFRVLHRFSRSERHTRWDLLNAVTAQAHHAPDAKSARGLELLGAAIAEHRLETHARPPRWRHVPEGLERRQTTSNHVPRGYETPVPSNYSIRRARARAASLFCRAVGDRMASTTDSRRACSVQVPGRQGKEHRERANERT